MASTRTSTVVSTMIRGALQVFRGLTAVPRVVRLPTASSNGLAFRQPVALLTTQTGATLKQSPKTVNITFIDRDGEEHTVKGKVGDSLLEVAKEFDVDLEGSCEGTLSCSTCHLVVDPEWYKKIPDPLTEEEQDMLDLAFGLTDTSRLGCQILVSDALEGIRLKVPTGTRDVREL